MTGRMSAMIACAIWTSLSPKQRRALSALGQRPLHRVRAGWVHDLGQESFPDSTLAALSGRGLAVRTGIDEWKISGQGLRILECSDQHE